MKLAHACALVAASVVTTTLAPTLDISAAAASAVQITGVQYDSPGSDRGGNRSLNGEWVRITNKSSARKSLTGWTLRDRSNHVYRFSTFSLGAGKSVRVHTGKGTNTATDRYQRRGWYVWNNDSDKAILRNASGVTVSTRAW